MKKKEIKVDIDIKNTVEAGFDSYLNRSNWGAQESINGLSSRYQSLRNLSGGLLSSESKFYMGNQQMYFDGGQVKQAVHDGTSEVVIIGRLP